MGPAGGLRGALLGSCAKTAARSCGGLAASSGGHLATPPILTTRPCPAIPLNTHGQPLAGLGCCCSSLTTRGCPSRDSTSCQVIPVGEPARWLEAPEPQRPRAGGGGGEGGVVGALPRPCQLWPAMALPTPVLLPPQLPLLGRG